MTGDPLMDDDETYDPDDRIVRAGRAARSRRASGTLLDGVEAGAALAYQKREIERIRWLRRLAVSDDHDEWVKLRHADRSARGRANLGMALTPSEQEAVRLMRVLSRWLQDIEGLKLQYRRNAADRRPDLPPGMPGRPARR